MSLEISSSNFRTQDSFFSIELASQSNQFTPIMELEGASASSSDFQPRVLHFVEQILPPEHNHQIKSIELLYGSRIYESFEVQQDPPEEAELEIRDLEDHYLRTEQLFPFSAEKAESEELVIASCSSQMMDSMTMRRKTSMSFFCDQLAELKKNVSKLMNIISRNPEENKHTPPSCIAPRPTFQPHSKENIEAKSTSSQQLKDHCRQIEHIISHFHSPGKSEEKELQDISPIQPRDYSLGSNVNEVSTRSLMRRKMKNSGQLSSNSA